VNFVMYEFDEMKIYRGKDIFITPKIMVVQPTIDQIIDFGERKYFNAVHNLCGVGADFKWQLWDYSNIDYTQIEDFDLFIKFISHLVSSKKRLYDKWLSNPEEYKQELANLTSQEDIDAMYFNPLALTLKKKNAEGVFEPLDLADFQGFFNNQTQQPELYDVVNDVKIDRAVYTRMVDAVRQIHYFKRNSELPANEKTKMDLIDDARDEAMAQSRQPYKSMLKPLVSALTVKCGLCGDNKIYNMTINAFLDNIKRVGKIQDAELLLQGAYSGFSSLKGVDRTRLEWAGEI